MIPLQLRGGIEEILPHQIGIETSLFDCPADTLYDLAPQLGRPLPGQHVAHVHPPAVGGEGRAQPAPEDGVLERIHPAAEFGTPIVELGQHLHAQPGEILLRIVGKGEEVRLWRVGVGERGLEPGVPITTVIRDDIEQVAHAPSVEGAAQLTEGLVAAKVGIHVIVIDHIVLVARGRAEDGVEIERVDAQLLEVIEMLENAGQIAAVKGE